MPDPVRTDEKKCAHQTCTCMVAGERTRLVPPTELSLHDRVAFDRLVHSACHPLYSAAKRIIVFARLQGAR